MNINRSNYEIYFIDHFDGLLDQKSEQELMAFLKLNPDLSEEFSAFEVVEISPDTICFPHKASLKKTPVASTGNINENNYPEILIASIENELDQLQGAELKEFLELNPSLARDFKAYSKTILKPDPAIVYPDKQVLKKWILIPLTRKLVIQWSAAAVLLLLITTGWFMFEKRMSGSVNDEFESLISNNRMTPAIPFPIGTESSESSTGNDNLSQVAANVVVESKQPDQIDVRIPASDERTGGTQDQNTMISSLFTLPPQRISVQKSDVRPIDAKQVIEIPQYVEFALVDSHTPKRNSVLSKVFSRLVRKSTDFLLENKNLELLGEFANINKPELENVSFKNTLRSDDSKVTFMSLGDSFYFLKSKSTQ